MWHTSNSSRHFKLDANQVMSRFMIDFSSNKLSRGIQNQRGTAILEQVFLFVLIVAICAGSSLRGLGNEVNLRFTCAQQKIDYAMAGGGSATTEDLPEAHGPGPCGDLSK